MTLLVEKPEDYRAGLSAQCFKNLVTPLDRRCWLSVGLTGEYQSRAYTECKYLSYKRSKKKNHKIKAQD